MFARLVPLLLITLLVACRPGDTDPVALEQSPTATVAPEPSVTPQPTPTAEPSATPQPTPTSEPSATPDPTPTPEPSVTPPPSATPAPTVTVDPFGGITTVALRSDRFGTEGEIERVTLLEERAGFTRYRVRYPSDGLMIDGFMNVPTGEGRYPVVIVNHGYMPPEVYNLLTYTTRYADALAEAGFLVLHPSFRNHRGSERGENPFRVGYARDLLHLIPMARRLPEADGGPVGLWGHSMGGGITLRALTVDDSGVGAAVLYGSMSGDEARNYFAIMDWSDGEAARNGSLPLPPQGNEALYAAISPLREVATIGVPIQIHHGVLDDQVPIAWSVELADALAAVGVPHTLFAYDGQGHLLAGEADRLFRQRVVDFFRSTLVGDG